MKRGIKHLILGVQTERPKEYEAFESLNNYTEEVERKVDAISFEVTEFCRAYSSVDLAIATASTVVLAFNRTRDQKGRFHDNVVNNSWLKVEHDNWYTFGSTVLWDDTGEPNTYRILEIRLTRNGVASTLAGDSRTSNTNIDTRQFVMGEAFLYFGDYIEVLAAHGGAGTINLLASPFNSPEFWISSKVGGR